MIPFGIFAYGAWRVLKRAEWDFEMVAYTPRVSSEMLPADEILVRRSEPPTLQSEVLLRATQKGQETPKEELLRGVAPQTNSG